MVDDTAKVRRTGDKSQMQCCSKEVKERRRDGVEVAGKGEEKPNVYKTL